MHAYATGFCEVLPSSHKKLNHVFKFEHILYPDLNLGFGLVLMKRPHGG